VSEPKCDCEREKESDTVGERMSEWKTKELSKTEREFV
jgi:hypothetical protein